MNRVDNVFYLTLPNIKQNNYSILIDLLKNYCNEKVLQYNCNLKVYFEGSSRVDFSNLNFKPLRLNEEIKEMHYGLEKSF